SGIRQQHISAAILSGLNGVEEYTAGVSIFLAGNDLTPHTVSPRFELVNGSGTKRVARREHDFLSCVVELLGQLSNCGCLACAIDAYKQDHRWVPRKDNPS